MIFCGDFAYPFSDSSNLKIHDMDDVFLRTPKTVNFESTIDIFNGNKTTSGIAISSHLSAFDVLDKLNVVGATLANNHIMDFDYDVDILLDKFREEKIKTVGLGGCSVAASKSTKIGDYEVFNFGWSTIGCKPATDKKAGCNPLDYDHVIQTISSAIRAKPSSKIAVVFHWNYEFELYPQPLHRKLAKHLIDLGVSAVIGHHSHIIQGAELYKGKPIVYGLGNFYLPKFNYSGYYLDFVEEAYTGLAVNIETLDSFIVTSKDNELSVSEPVPLFENELVKRVSPFSGLSDEEYLKFFRDNRKKRKLLPIYNSKGIREYINNIFVLIRQKAIDFLVRSNLKKHAK